MIIIKNKKNIRKDFFSHMKEAGRLASEVLDYITPFVQINTTTNELDFLCNQYMTHQQKTIPAPLHYQPMGYPPFPKSICTSINDVVCHGIPENRKLKNGDILNIDVTIITEAGYYGDTSRMFVIGESSIEAKKLCQVTYEAMWIGIAQVKPEATLGDIGYAIQSHAEKKGYSIVREYCGHGIHRVFHTEPQILHYGKPGTGAKLKEGMTFTIEPMINQGEKDVYTMSDKWTVKTKDGNLSAQWEHTCFVTSTGVEVLTVSDGSPELPACVKDILTS